MACSAECFNLRSEDGGAGGNSVRDCRELEEPHHRPRVKPSKACIKETRTYFCSNFQGSFDGGCCFVDGTTSRTSSPHGGRFGFGSSSVCQTGRHSRAADFGDGKASLVCKTFQRGEPAPKLPIPCQRARTRRPKLQRTRIKEGAMLGSW